MTAEFKAWHGRERIILADLFGEAVRSANPRICVPPLVPSPLGGKYIVVGAGKAAAAMAKAVEDTVGWPISGFVVTRYGYAKDIKCQQIEVMEAGHPTPDENSVIAAGKILRAVGGLNQNDLVLVLISGGGSALLTAPPGGITLADKQQITAQLLASGATIHEINCVRKHLSRIKGGRLCAAAYPARVVTIAISDVVGNDPAVIASGPTVADRSTRQQALDILQGYRLKVPPSVNAWLSDPESETIKPGDTLFENTSCQMAANSSLMLRAVEAKARDVYSLNVINLGDDIEGEASEVAARHAARAKSAPSGTLLLSGGELTVTLGADYGKGGPNTEYALAMAHELSGSPHITCLAADTDGIDGSEDNAGAFADGNTKGSGDALGLDIIAALSHHDSFSYFAKTGDLFTPGPTATNVNDFRAILVS
jgi:glycerate 2-kinase